MTLRFGDGEVQIPSLWSPQALSLFPPGHKAVKNESAQAWARPAEASSEETWRESPSPLSLEWGTLRSCGLESLPKVKRDSIAASVWDSKYVKKGTNVKMKFQKW